MEDGSRSGEEVFPGNIHRILYISWSVLPSATANAVQVVRMVNALAETGRADTALVARRARNDRRPPAEIAHAVGLDNRVRLTLLPASRIRAGIRLLRHARSGGPDGPLDAVYSRVLPVLLFHLPAARRIFEVHEPPRATWRFKPAVFDRAVGRGAITDLVYISGGLRRIVERDHASALARGAPARLVLHSAGPSPEPWRDPPGSAPFTIAYAGRPEKLDPAIVWGIAKAHPDVAIEVFGGGGDGHRHLEDCPSVMLRGWVDPHKMPRMLTRAHILIAPYGDLPAAAWFSPVKIFDYAAAGRPILASDHPAIRDIFPDGEIGRLLPVGDVEAWTRAVAALREDRALGRRMGEAARAFASRHDFRARANAIVNALAPAPHWKEPK